MFRICLFFSVDACQFSEEIDEACRDTQKTKDQSKHMRGATPSIDPVSCKTADHGTHEHVGSDIGVSKPFFVFVRKVFDHVQNPPETRRLYPRVMAR